MIIIRDDGTDPRVVRLLEEHLEDMHRHSPPDSVHALDLSAIRAPDVSFWTVWHGADLLGCGALRALDPAHGELKSMRTSRQHRRRGAASALLDYIIAEASARSYRRISLETGAAAPFVAAQALYLKYGFRYCDPFDGYTNDPHSRFMALDL